MIQVVPFRARPIAAAVCSDITFFSLNYHQLIDLVANEMDVSGRSKQQVSNRVSALSRFLESCAVKKSDIVGKELNENFDEHVMELTDAMRLDGKGERYIRDTLGQLLFWRGAQERLSKVDVLPTGFHECLVRLMVESGVTTAELARVTNIGIRTLRDWKYGLRC